MYDIIHIYGEMHFLGKRLRRWCVYVKLVQSEKKKSDVHTYDIILYSAVRFDSLYIIIGYSNIICNLI